jgi:hypothetical protein
VYWAGGAAHPAEHAGAFGAGQVLVAPPLERAEDHLELAAGRVSRYADRVLAGLSAGVRGLYPQVA